MGIDTFAENIGSPTDDDYFAKNSRQGTTEPYSRKCLNYGQ